MNQSTNNMNNNQTQFDENKINYQNICSWLLIFSPIELAVLSTIVAIILSANLTIEEQTVLSSFLEAVGGEMQLITAQLQLVEAARNELDKLSENDQKQNSVDELKQKLEEANKKIDKLETLINQHINQTSEA